MLENKLRFGAFIAPFHPLDENPTLAIQRDLELVQHLDNLGFCLLYTSDAADE